MKLKKYPPEQRISSDETYGSFPFSKCKPSIVFADVIEHILTKHAHKPPQSSERNSVTYDTAAIPISFLKTVRACQQRPHIDYNHQENNCVQG